MASNMIRFGQLIETNYTMRFEDKEWKVFGRSSKLIMKSPLLNNVTFKVMINMLDHQCL